MNRRTFTFALASLALLSKAKSLSAAEPLSLVPAKWPRTLVPAGQLEAFRAYCLTGDGTKNYRRIKADLDAIYLAQPPPPEPLTYGDPNPSTRDSAKADKWRDAQDVCGRVSGIAEAATLCWLVTGEERYFAKAREMLLAVSDWKFEPDWKRGPQPGTTDIFYNDEAHFRLWRKLPAVFDQLRDKLSAVDKAKILAHFKERGARSARWIRAAKVPEVKRNSLETDAASHPVRFMAMTGISGLALWDDLPEARDWWSFGYTFYRDQFSPWGGDDGGWAEGPAYWRGTFEHASFQDALLAIGDPLAYATTFWRQSPYFAVYNVQPYLHTIFGDTSNAGRFNLDPTTADFLEHMSRVLDDGHLLAYAQLCTDGRQRPDEKGLSGLDRTYPTAAEFLIRDFTASARAMPKPASLSRLPRNRYYRDIGWVSLHSALGRPSEDIHVTFKASPYGSYSHSHGDQNSFILNAFGESLAINSAYREFHRSPHHKEWTWHTKSKNALLIDGVGQKPQDKKATGKILRYEEKERTVWTTGDAKVAYQTMQPKGRVKRATRDLVFVDSRYVVLRDRVELADPAQLSWLLHGEHPLDWDAVASMATIRGTKASLTATLAAKGTAWTGSVTKGFPVPVDPKYASGTAGAGYVTAKWSDHFHFEAKSPGKAQDHTLFAVLWPERGPKPAPLSALLESDGTLVVQRPDGRKDRIRITDTALSIE